MIATITLYYHSEDPVLEYKQLYYIKNVYRTMYCNNQNIRYYNN